MKFIIGKKLGMTQIFLPSGEVVPVTRVLAGPCPVVQVLPSKIKSAVQIGFGEARPFRLSKPLAGHLKDLPSVKELRQFAIESVGEIKRGQVVTIDTFAVGDKVTVVGISKGKGFAGVVKRHHFRGAPASHGHKHDLRMPGSIGAGGVQRVFKGMRMGGRMGGAQVTVKNLEIIEIHPATNELYIKGAIPGSRNGIVEISAPGELKIVAPVSVELAAEAASEVSDSTPVAATEAVPAIIAAELAS